MSRVMEIDKTQIMFRKNAPVAFAMITWFRSTWLHFWFCFCVECTFFLSVLLFPRRPKNVCSMCMIPPMCLACEGMCCRSVGVSMHMKRKGLVEY